MNAALYFVSGALCIAIGGTLVRLSLRKRRAFYVTRPHEEEK